MYYECATIAALSIAERLDSFKSSSALCFKCTIKSCLPHGRAASVRKQRASPFISETWKHLVTGRLVTQDDMEKQRMEVAKKNNFIKIQPLLS